MDVWGGKGVVGAETAGGLAWSQSCHSDLCSFSSQG